MLCHSLNNGYLIEIIIDYEVRSCCRWKYCGLYTKQGMMGRYPCVVNKMT